MSLIELLTTIFALFFIVAIRYLFFSYGAYLLGWKWKRREWFHRRVQLKFPSPKIIRNEFWYSMSTSFIFAISGGLMFYAWRAGWTQVYLDIGDYGWAYFFLSIVVMILFHETYFYWSHRWMHRPEIFPIVHKIHHDSSNPSPLAAFSFHPLEAIIEAAFLPMIVFVLPAHPAALLFFLMFMTVLGVVNHYGIEIYPKWFCTHPVMKGLITVTHHNMHHSKVTCNYGLYFTWWDFLMKTHHKDYEKTFLEVKSRVPGSVPFPEESRSSIFKTHVTSS